MTIAEVKTIMGQDGIFCLDVRSRAEFESSHIQEAFQIPLDQLSSSTQLKEREKEDHLILICQSGQRAQQAQDTLSQEGFQNLSVMEGGMTAWEEAGYETVEGRKTISLERQVRITAGALVAIGCLLALTVNSNFLYLPLFIGCGLVFAGISNTCGMGLLLAKMPWNTRCGS